MARDKEAKNVWIGLSDTATKGGYLWVDGTPYVYSAFTPEAFNWFSANTGNNRGKCVSVNETAGGWSYDDCSDVQSFICKLKPNGKSIDNEV